MGTELLRDDRVVMVAGTSEAPPPPSNVRIGAVSALIDAGALRRLTYGSVELVRRVDFTIRDENWATYAPTVTHEHLDASSDHFRFEQHFDVADGALSCTVVYEGGTDGTITAVGEATAHRDFATNRTGFTVLHPVDGVAGRPVDVTAPDGTKRREVMPDLISPAQPMEEFVGLTFDVDGVPVAISFSGDVFEMEDQRNWSDASFKTYCPPLRENGLYVIPAGTTIRQEITIRVDTSATVPAAPTALAASVTIGDAVGERLPALSLAADVGWLPSPERAASIAAFGPLLVRVTPSNATTLLGHVGTLALRDPIDLEIVLDDEAPVAPQLAAVADACRSAGLSPARVMALPKAYLTSYQPGGTWPTGPSPADTFEAARIAFPDVSVGAGMLTNFTELNRHRPDGLDADYIAHGNSAIVHAADDLSVDQTLVGLHEIFRTARAIIGDRPYRLGLTAIGMRTNPYGSAVSPNPDQHRITMATWDPRARALFGAAWAIGALAATEGHGIEAIALAAPVGPFGVMAEPGPVARAWYDDHAEAVVYPIFHALAALAAGGERHRVEGLADGLAGVAATNGHTTRLVIANTSTEPHEFALDVAAGGAVLDTASFVDAVTDIGWLDRAFAGPSPATVVLEPSAMLFAELDAEPRPDGNEHRA